MKFHPCCSLIAQIKHVLDAFPAIVSSKVFYSTAYNKHICFLGSSPNEMSTKSSVGYVNNDSGIWSENGSGTRIFGKQYS